MAGAVNAHIGAWMTDALNIVLFGGFRVTSRDGASLALASRKHRALLAYLAAHRGKGIRRERLIDLLWGENAEKNARHSLAQALYKIRGLDGGSGIVVEDDGGVRLDESRVAVDLDHFLALAKEGSLDSLALAVEICSGPVLDGFDLDEEPFDDWLRGLREQVHDDVAALNLRLCAGLLGEGRHAEAVAAARRGVTQDPLNEELHKLLIRALSADGRELEALRQFKVLRERLQSELAVEPAPETVAEISRIVDKRNGRKAVDSVSQPTATMASRQMVEAMPAIAVHPFELRDSCPDGQYLAKGIAEDIAGELSRFHCLAVLTGGTVFDDGFGHERGFELTEMMGGSHCVRGSLQVLGDAYRLKVQLLELPSRRLIWSERYDVPHEDIFEFQDDVVARIVATLFGRLVDDRTGGARQQPTQSLQAYDCVLRGLAIHRSGHLTRSEAEKAVAWFDRALDCDPNYARAHAWRACAAYHLWPEQPSQDYIDCNMQSVVTALSLDGTDSEAHRIKGSLHAFQRQYDLAEHHLGKARELNPNDAQILVKNGLYQSYFGNHEAGLREVDLSIQRNPLHPDWYWRDRGIVLFGLGAYWEALEALRLCQEGRELEYVYQAAALAALGEAESARAQISKVWLQRNSEGLDWLDVALPYRCYKKPEDRERLREFLSIAVAK